MFLQAAEMSGMKAQFDLPGFTATILAPSDAALTTFLNGTASQYVEFVVEVPRSFICPRPCPCPCPCPCPRPCPGPGPKALSLSLPESVVFFLPLPVSLVSELLTETLSGMCVQALQQLLNQAAACIRLTDCPASLPVVQ